MEFQSLNCPGCGSPLDYVQGMAQVQCSHCGGRYALGNPSVQAIPYMGGPLFYGWIPQGWNVQVYEDDQDASRDAWKPFSLCASSQEATLYFFPIAFHKDARNERPHFNPVTLTNPCKYVPLSQYPAYRIRQILPQAQNIQVNPLNDPTLEPLARNFAQRAGQVIANPQIEQGKFQVAFDYNGTRMYGIFAAALAHAGTGHFQQAEQAAQTAPSNQPPQPPRQKSGSAFDFFMRGGLIGAAMRHEELPDSLGFSMDGMKQGLQGMTSGLGTRNNWARGYDFFLVTPNSRLDLYNQILNDFALNLQYGPMYAQLEQQEGQAVNNVMIQGNMQRQQNQMMANQRLQQTISQRNNIIMSGYENRRAAQDRMMGNYSEALRGVNSYTNSYGQTVEASVRYDHVYQNGSDYIASDANLNLGPDWDELKRNR